MLLDSYINGRVAYKKGEFTLSYIFDTSEWYNQGYWQVRDGQQNVVAWGLDFEGTCPVGADQTWIIGDMDSKQRYTGFKIIAGTIGNLFYKIP